MSRNDEARDGAGPENAGPDNAGSVDAARDGAVGLGDPADDEPAPLLAPLPGVSEHPIAGLYVRHLLAVEDDVEPEEIEALAMSRFPATRWESAPEVVRTKGVDRLVPGTLRTSRHTTVSGPYAPETADGRDLGLDRPVGMVYEVLCPRERGAAPYPGGGDRDGLARVYSEAFPIREEARVAAWLVAVARRVCGVVRFDLGDSGYSTVVPDPAVSVDLAVYSDVWLSPGAALSVCAGADPSAALASTGTPWAGPPPTAGTVPVEKDGPLTPAQLAGLHERAEEGDIAALTGPRTLSAYAIEVDLGDDGLVTVEVSGVEQLPLVLRGLAWAVDGAISYQVRWTPEDLVDWQRELPSFEHRVSRTRAAGIVAALARAVYGAVGGEVVDQDEFLVEPDDI